MHALDDPAVLAVVERQRAHIDTWFYDCSTAFLVTMSGIWVNDPRFTKNIDKAAPGLAAFKYAAVQAWGQRLGVSDT